MSSAILYLAIVGIWAGFLVPAWVRRPHNAKLDDDLDLGTESSAEQEEPSHEAEHAASEEPDQQAGIHAEADGHEQEYRDEVPSHPQTPRSGQVARPPAPSVPQSRQQMMRARRRMLKILVAMTLGTAAFAMLGVFKWWICVPPAGMLTLYVLLLREIAMADAELAHKRQAQAVQAARDARRHAMRVRAEQAAEGLGDEDVEPGAQIIDISGRVGDQLYDQYADAAVRAVGD